MTATICLTIVETVCVLLLADLCSGIVHWIQDRYEVNENSLLNRIVILYAGQHHDDPRAFTSLTWWQRNSFAVCMIIGVAFILSALNLLYWQISLFLVLFMLSGEFHFCSHRSQHENNFLVSKLQKIHVIQSASHHWNHHAGHKGYYCVITNVMNPILDRTNFFDLLEFLVAKTTGIQSKDDHAPVGRGVSHA